MSVRQLTGPPPTPLRLTPLASSPRVTVLIASYNYGRFLPAAIESVLAQTYANLEVIVCDDGSTDDSAAIADHYSRRDPRVKLLCKENGGQASAWNAAFAACTGDIICPLDADDTFAPEKVANIVAYCASHPNCGCVVHSMMVVNAGGEDVQRIPFLTPFEDGWIAECVVRRGGRWRYMPSSALALRRDVAQRIFPIPGTLRVCADAFVFTLAPLLTVVGSIWEPLSQYRVHGANQISASVSDLRSARNVAAWSERVVEEVNARLVSLAWGGEQLDLRNDLQYLETCFIVALLTEHSRAELLRDFAQLSRALLDDDLYGSTQKLLGLIVYGASIGLPAGARQRWLATTLGPSRAKQAIAGMRGGLVRLLPHRQRS